MAEGLSGQHSCWHLRSLTHLRQMKAWVSVRWRVLTAITPSATTALTLLIVVLLTGSLVVRPGLSVTPVGKIPIMGLEEGCDVVHSL